MTVFSYDCVFFERHSFLLSIRLDLLIVSLDLIQPVDSTPRVLSRHPRHLQKNRKHVGHLVRRRP